MISITRQPGGASLDEPLTRMLRTLLDLAYEGDFSGEDWNHAEQGERFLGYTGGELVAHACVVERQMTFDGLSYAVGYVEAVAVHPAHQGQGFGTRLMISINEFCLDRFVVSMLSTGEKDFYRRLGWIDFAGKSFTQTPKGLIRTADEDEGLMLFGERCESFVNADVICDFRAGDVW